MEETRCEKCKGAIEGPVLVRDDGHDLLFYHVACYYGGSAKSVRTDPDREGDYMSNADINGYLIEVQE